MMSVELRSGNPEEVGMCSDRVNHVRELAQGWVAREVIPALVVLAARKGVVVLHEAFGNLRPEPDSPQLELDAVFPLTSLTKPVTATAATILVEQGKIGLNRPVTEYIPEFVGEGKDRVSVHHLLTHTSGIVDDDVKLHSAKKKDQVEIPPPPQTQHPAIHAELFLGYDAPLTLSPGTEQRYSSFGFELVGEIVRRISGKSLDEFAREKLFQPIGMTDTFYVVPDQAKSRVAHRPLDAPLAWIDGPDFQDTPSAAIGAYSTAMDLAILGQMYLNGGAYGNARVLSPVTVAEMTRNQIPGVSSQFVDEVFPEAGTGFSWFIRENKKVTMYGEALQSAKTFCHGGAGGVFFWVDPVHEIVGTYFSADRSPITVADTYRYTRCDLFINAITAAIVDL